MLTGSELIERKKTVNHGAIVPIGSTSQDDKEEKEVSGSQVGRLEPVDVWKLFAGDLEMAGGDSG
jgi:hypothetical protein